VFNSVLTQAKKFESNWIRMDAGRAHCASSFLKPHVHSILDFGGSACFAISAFSPACGLRRKQR
jgi:hypothetical protein